LQVKLITLPLNYKQIESTTKMQLIQPKVRDWCIETVIRVVLMLRAALFALGFGLFWLEQMKELQKKYKSDPQLQQQMLAKLYEENNVSGGGVSG
jgi:Tfp pilus assembly protein PilO